MSTWVIISWVLVAILTVINIIVFLQLKKASEQMMKMAFPNAKNMNEALASMQAMMGGMQGGMGGMRGRGGPAPMGRPGGKGSDAQLKAAIDMLQQMQKGKKR